VVSKRTMRENQLYRSADWLLVAKKGRPATNIRTIFIEYIEKIKSGKLSSRIQYATNMGLFCNHPRFSKCLVKVTFPVISHELSRITVGIGESYLA